MNTTHTHTHHHSRHRTHTGLAVFISGLTLTLTVSLTACGGGGRTDPATKEPVPLPSPTAASQQMSEKNLGYMWPLTVDHGTAECRKGEQAVFTTPDGTTYALNDRAEDAGYRNIDAVRATGEGGDKVSLGTLLSTTMKLCRFSR
ncbi:MULTISPECIES: DUF2511 domain-containing protein [unclassified Streptomyces]|uniref:DUF2511 domain-containing protein n=1 Tax=unclassified Streptomyces TaxID=2593676 RepID=UPI0033B3FED8